MTKLAQQLERVLDRLDARLEQQTLRKGADRATALVDSFHNLAGFVERRVLPHADSMHAAQIAVHLRQLRGILRQHREALA